MGFEKSLPGCSDNIGTDTDSPLRAMAATHLNERMDRHTSSGAFFVGDTRLEISGLKVRTHGVITSHDMVKNSIEGVYRAVTPSSPGTVPIRADPHRRFRLGRRLALNLGDLLQHGFPGLDPWEAREVPEFVQDE